jgi:ferredoxin
VLKEGKYLDVFSDVEVEFVPFSECMKKDIGTPFGMIDIARDALAADVVINLAKLKTHSQMLLTLGVKNLFGCIVGYRKPEWHLRSGIDREIFASLLVQIYQAVRPSITIIDGIVSLEGQGPGKSGKPKKLGVLVGSRNAAAADMAVCKMLGLDPNHLPTHISARASGLIDETISINGSLPPVAAFKFPVLAPLTFGPRSLRNIIRKHLVQRPVVDPMLCKQCGECWQYCPAKAITPGVKQIQFDYAGCIRCYCCIEVCPHGALRSAETLTGWLVRRLPFITT